MKDSVQFAMGSLNPMFGIPSNVESFGHDGIPSAVWSGEGMQSAPSAKLVLATDGSSRYMTQYP